MDPEPEAEGLNFNLSPYVLIYPSTIHYLCPHVIQTRRASFESGPPIFLIYSHANQRSMWVNAGLSTSILITTCSPAHGMVHHTVARTFVSTKLRDFGPKSSTARTFWRMVATCIRYEPPMQHLLSDLTTFSLASVKTPCVGTGFLGLAYTFLPHNISEDISELPLNPPICSGDSVRTIRCDDVLRLAMTIPLPPMGPLETVLLSLKEGQSLSESTMRRLRRKDVEMRAAAAEGRAPLSEYKMRKQKKTAARALTAHTTNVPSSKMETMALKELGHNVTARAYSPPMSKHLRQRSGAMQLVSTACMIKSGLRKVSVEDIESIAASATMNRRPRGQDPMPPVQVQTN